VNTIDVSFPDILSEIEKLTKKNPNGFTMQEMADEYGRSDGWCRKQIRKMIMAGTVKYNGKATRLSIDERPFLVPVYIFLQRKTKRNA